MPTELNTSQYISHTESAFVQAMKKVKDMEAILSAERLETIPEYAEEKKKAISFATDLIKMGEERTVSDDVVYLTIGEEKFGLNIDEFRTVLDEDQFRILFPEEDVPEPEETEYESVTQNAYGWPDGKGGISVQYVNPLANLLSALLTPLVNPQYMGMEQAKPIPKGSSDGLSKDMDSISRKVTILENERNEAKKKLEELKGELNKSKSRIEEIEAELESTKSASCEKETALQEQVNALEEEKKAQEEKITQLTDQIIEANTASKLFEEEYDRLKKEIEDAKSTIEAREQECKDLSSQIAEKETVIATIKDELSRFEAIVSEKDSQLKTLEDSISSEKGIKAKAEESLKEKETKIAELEERIQNDERQMQSLRDKESRSSKRIGESEKYVESIRKEKETIKRENDTLKEEISKLKDSVSKLKEGDTEKIAYYKRLEAEAAELKRLAYTDVKFGTMNLNAFNRDFSGVRKDATILAMVSICGMKSANNDYGRESGDNIIRAVSNSLMRAFGAEKTYRIMGDQFAIITEGNEASIQGSLFNIQRSLQDDSIKIVFGLSVGSRCNDLGQMVSVAESTMRQMKQNGASAAPIPAETTFTPQPVQESKPAINERPAESNDSDIEEVEMDEMLMGMINGN